MTLISSALDLCTPINVPASSHRQDERDIRFRDRIQSAHSYSFERLSNVAILGVPQDIGVQRNGGRVGASKAPEVIREFLWRLTISSGVEELPADFQVIDAGDVKCDGCSLEEIQERQYKIVRALLDVSESVIVLGGGHDIAFASARALASTCDSLGVVNVDAHLDVRPLIVQEDARLAHSGSPFRQILENPSIHIPRGCFVEFGIQPFVAAAHHIEYVLTKGHQVLMLNDVRALGVETTFAAEVNSIASSVVKTAENATESKGSLYCSFDMDAVASAYAPGVSAPASDGFSAQEMIAMVRIAASQSSCRVLDLVEVNPAYDTDSRTARLAAILVAHAIWQKSQMSA